MTGDEDFGWTEAAWLAEVENWIQEGVAAQGLSITGSIEQPHIKSWGTIMVAPTEQGDVYFKAMKPLLPHETAITESLSNWFPDLLPKLFKVDAERSWLLIADGGSRLRDAFNEGLEIKTWSPILTAYARLQIEIREERIGELLAMGAPDRRLGKLPQLYKELLADTEWLLIGQEDGLSSEEYERLLAGQARIEQLCSQLESFGIPAAFNHGDLHDGNVLYQDGRFLFFDWGDSQISHPFFSLRGAFVSMENTFGYEEDDPRFDDFARDYLKAWVEFDSQDRLWEAYQVAQRLWAIPSMLQWKFVMSRLETLRRVMGYAVPSLLKELLKANPGM
jgi:hypothetical protein